jgi:ferredoxin
MQGGHGGIPGEMAGEATRFLPGSGLQDLIDELRGRGMRVLGTRLEGDALAWDEVLQVGDLPVGWRDRQEPGAWRVEDAGSGRVFDVVHGPGSLKPWLFAPREELLQIELDGRSFRARETLPEPPRTAFLGVRACDLAALAVQDRIFLHDRYPDPQYAARRARIFVVAVGCTRSVSTCFCASMDTGPAPRAGYDLALTELDGGFVVRTGSAAGGEVLAALSTEPAPEGLLEEESSRYAACAAGMQRRMETSDLPDLLYRNLDHPRWDEVAGRCLSCANCTLVCPTCFCHDEKDEPAPDGRTSLRVREWDSCFNREHAQVHGHNFRPQIAHRYRQWLVHKVAAWIDQFGTSGCTGCGRCITWCPVGIDLTEEVAAIRATSGTRSGEPPG